MKIHGQFLQIHVQKKQKFYGGEEYEEETYGLREYVLPILLYSVEQFPNSQIRD